MDKQNEPTETIKDRLHKSPSDKQLKWRDHFQYLSNIQNSIPVKSFNWREQSSVFDISFGEKEFGLKFQLEV